MPNVLHLDFETRSAAELKKTGVYRYAEDPTTDIWCAAYALDDGPVGLWVPGDPIPEQIGDTILSGGAVYAHNAQFERIIWREILGPRYGFPVPALEQFYCTAAMAAAMSLPRDLDTLGEALGLDVVKDKKGSLLMKRMAKPRKVGEWEDCPVCAYEDYEPVAGEDCPVCGGQKKVFNAERIIWWDDEERKQGLFAYCITDVETERAATKKMKPLSPEERRVYLLDQEINDRGIYIDAETAESALKIIDQASKGLDARMRQVTNGAVEKASQVQRLVDWLAGQGVEIPNLRKQQVADFMAGAEDLPEGLPDHAREALEIRLEAAKASTKKIQAMLSSRSGDGRVRGTLLYHGASTGRWAGRLLQVQNIKRPELLDDAELFIRAIRSGRADILDSLWGSPMTVISDTLRSILMAAPGEEYACADFSNIEGRGIAWLAGEKWKLEAFRAFDEKRGDDLYKIAASGIYNVNVKDVTKPQRQIGKVSELACGFQGGVGAFQAMAKIYGVKIPDEEANQIKEAWRAKNPKIKQFWYDLESAAIEAVRFAGKKVSLDKIAFIVKYGCLWMRLPSGRLLCYPQPRLEEVQTPWGATKEGVTHMGVDPITKKWLRMKTYGGKLSENATQAVARDVMVDSMFRAEAEGFKIIFTVHDEIVSAVPLGGPLKVKRLEEIMSQPPVWAQGMPIAAEGWQGVRYRK